MIWIQDSLHRILPETEPASATTLDVAGARGEVVAFQVGVQPDATTKPLQVKVTGPLAKRATVRLAGLVPIEHHTVDTPAELLEGHVPGFVPDPLVPLDAVRHGEGVVLEAGISRSFWVTVRLPSKAAQSELRVEVLEGDVSLGDVTAKVETWPFTLPRLKMPVAYWFYSDAVCDWYGVEPFSRRYWELVERYFKNLVDHHQNVIYTPLFTPPLDNKKRDLQLVDVTETSPGQYRFGWSKVRRWLDLARANGFQHFEMSHLFSQWGAARAIRILVKRTDGRVTPLCGPQTAATAKVYRAFLEQFLPKLVALLQREGIFDQCWFHLSDEPHGEAHLEQYRAVREMVRDIVPEVEITEALSDYGFYEHGLVDHPVPIISSLPAFLDAGVRPMTYYCCGPQGSYPNRFLDYPLYRLRVLGLMLFRYDLAGFLHWGGNYWYRGGTTEMIDPYRTTDAQRWPGWSVGDPFVVYPGAEGPVDSIRWETYRSAIDDYRLLAAAAKRVGRERVMTLLSEIRELDDFPQSPEYLMKVRTAAAKLLSEG